MLVFANVAASPRDFALHQAVLDDDKQLVTLLLNKGAAIDVIGSRKYGYGSALHLAVREGRLKIAELLLDRGAQIDVLDPDDFTPLHNAAWNGNLAMTELLLDAGADINASTYDGDTPLSLAQNNDQTQVAEFIQIRRQASSVVDIKAESTPVSDTGVIDISGTYVSEITSSKIEIFRPRYRKLTLTLNQSGNSVIVTHTSAPIVFEEFTRDGNTISFLLGRNVPCDCSYAFGEWKISADGSRLEGKWEKSGGHYGKWNLTKIETETDQVMDVSGTYVADLSGDPKLIKKLLLGAKPEDNPVFVMVQNGDQIRVTVSGSKGAYGQIYGVIEGSTVRLRWILAKGKFNLKPGGNELTGTVMHTGSGAGVLGNAKLTLRKIESDAAQIPDISGTYISEITHKDLGSYLQKREYFGPQPKIEVKIEQNGNAIIGTISGDRSGEIKGVLTGNRITFYFNSKGGTFADKWGEGVWVVSDDPVILNGTWKDSNKAQNTNGIWNLKKIE